MNFCVVGSGIVGLTTALELQNQYRDARVTVLAHGFLDDTVSSVAAGIFRPGSSFEGPTQEITDKWLRDAYHYYDEIRKSSEANRIGVTQLSGYIFSTKSKSIVKNRLMEELCPTYRDATDDELTLCKGAPNGWKYGSFFTTLLTDTSYFLPWAIERFKSNGGHIVQERLKYFDDLQGKYDIVFNCTGMGAKYLLNDNKLIPIRGQVIKVKAPWIKTAFYGDYDTYIIPGFNGSVTLGGCRNYDSFDETLSKYDSAAIKERCVSMVPSLAKAETIKERVGLRPHRTPVRVEVEYRATEHGKTLKLIHNYGHGGYGVLSAPGTSKYAVELVQQAHARSKM